MEQASFGIKDARVLGDISPVTHVTASAHILGRYFRYRICIVQKYKRLLKCFNRGLEAQGDVIGVLIIARLHGDGSNGVLAHRWYTPRSEGLTTYLRV